MPTDRLAGIALSVMKTVQNANLTRGVTLIELVIVVAVMGILLSTAIPSYRSYMLRVHRTEAIRLLLRASMCQQRVRATNGHFDTSRCLPANEPQHYRLSYDPPDTQGGSFLATATPMGSQISDSCDSLTLDQSGTRGIGATDISIVKCWNGR